MKNYKIVTPKSGYKWSILLHKVIVHERFNYKALTGEMFAHVLVTHDQKTVAHVLSGLYSICTQGI